MLAAPAIALHLKLGIVVGLTIAPRAQGAKAYQEFTKEFLARERARKRARENG